MLFANRSHRGPDRLIAWKTGTLAAGLGFALLGIALRSSLLISVAIVVVLVGVVLRLFSRGRASSSESNHQTG